MRSSLISVLGCALALSGCAKPHPPVWVAPEGCRYVNIFVEPDSAALVEPFVSQVDEESEAMRRAILAEPVRQAVLGAAVRELRVTGFRVVEDPAEAWFRFGTSGEMYAANLVMVDLTLSAELKLANHLFLAQLDDDDFPYRGGVGTGYQIEFFVPLNLWRERDRIRDALRYIWSLEAEQILALCELESEFQSEGWADIDELQNELIQEMKQVRRQRAEQRRQLELKAEEPPIE